MIVRTPEGTQRHKINGLYPDVIVLNVAPGDVRCEGEVAMGNVLLVFEVEDQDSVNEANADQWVAYDNVFDPWCLVVPASAVDKAKKLMSERASEGPRSLRGTQMPTAAMVGSHQAFRRQTKKGATTQVSSME